MMECISLNVTFKGPNLCLKGRLCRHICVQVQEQIHCTEEAFYLSRNGIMRMRGWKPKPENSNMK